MRCFIAIDIDQGIRSWIDRLQRELEQKTGLTRPDVKWVDPALIHLTLKFLGEVRDAEITGVCKIAERVAANHKGFSLDVEKVGSFGSAARVLWVGIAPNNALSELQKELDEQLSKAGYPGDRKQFAGHLTLCRIKKPQAGRKLQELIKDYDDLNIGSFGVDSICVYKSELTGKGPIYTVVSRNLLKQQNY
ncbi:MAG: RNA 2',3'-cyclic phosphodiesterase [Planctomycetota bacterium]|jgi:2'-5' RNA ligase